MKPKRQIEKERYLKQRDSEYGVICAYKILPDGSIEIVTGLSLIGFDDKPICGEFWYDDRWQIQAQLYETETPD